MSSRRRRSRDLGNKQDVFSSNANSSDLEEFARMMYRTPDAEDELRRLESKSSRVKRIPINKIVPDPTQARRVMPNWLRLQWVTKPDSVVEVLNKWLELANEEAARRGRGPIDVPFLLSRDPDPSHPDEAGDAPSEQPDIGPIESDFRALIQLAASIRLHGLTNPITVVTLPNGLYQLETGERRLLAFNLLHMLPQYVEEESYEAIPARVVEEKNLWRQAAENGARQNLNAISIARQLALLLMDIYQEEGKFSTWSPQLDVEWYAQVYDSTRFPIPYGRGKEIAAVLGLKSANQLRQYRALLSLPKTVWQMADELDWTEYRIRQMMKSARQISSQLDKHDREVLEILAKHEAGIIPELPEGFGEEKTKPKVPEKTKSETIFWNQLATIAEIDIQAGTVTFQLVEPEVLGRLHDTEYVFVSVKKAD